MITLYDCATAPSPRRARIFLAEKRVPHETVQVDLRNGEQLGEAFRRINPQCTVPALVTEEGPVLTDNAAIAAYLEARFPNRRCWAARRWTRPTSPAGRRVSSWKACWRLRRPFATAARRWPTGR